jgi:hypothetical protein
MQLPLILQSLTAAIAITDGTGRLQSPAARVATDCLGARSAPLGSNRRSWSSRQTSLLEPTKQVGAWTFPPGIASFVSILWLLLCMHIFHASCAMIMVQCENTSPETQQSTSVREHGQQFIPHALRYASCFEVLSTLFRCFVSPAAVLGAGASGSYAAVLNYLQLQCQWWKGAAAGWSPAP